MAVSYNKLWKLLIDKEMSRTQMRLKAGISTKALAKLADSAKHFLVCELNMGQMVDDVKVATECKKPVSFFGRTGGVIPSPNDVLAEIENIAANLK